MGCDSIAVCGGSGCYALGRPAPNTCCVEQQLCIAMPKVQLSGNFIAAQEKSTQMRWLRITQLGMPLLVLVFTPAG